MSVKLPCSFIREYGAILFILPVFLVNIISTEADTNTSEEKIEIHSDEFKTAEI